MRLGLESSQRLELLELRLLVGQASEGDRGEIAIRQPALERSTAQEAKAAAQPGSRLAFCLVARREALPLALPQRRQAQETRSSALDVGRTVETKLLEQRLGL